MLRSAFLLVFIIIGSRSFSHSSLMYISAKPITCLGYSYEIEITQLSDVASDVVFHGIEIVYGDGNREEFPNGDFVHYEIDNDQAITKYIKYHTFQGPGIYTINARFFNRGSDIQNMDNSVNTPYYVRTVIHIDPFLGCNHTPELENLPFSNKTGSDYFCDFSFIDKENDSLSFHLATPLQGADIPVVNYRIPVEKDSTGSMNISKLTIDPYHCSLQWNTKKAAGDYTVAIQVIEWRKVDGTYYQISNSTLDYQISLQETKNKYPQISMLQDTAIVVGNNFTKSITISDPDGDSLKIKIYGDYSKLMNLQQNLDLDYLPGPIEKTINFTPIEENVRAKPYKLIFSATDKKDSIVSLSNIGSMYIWIADRDHEPEPPEKFIGQAISKELINIYWNDSDDELGYIVERADKYFPDFKKIVILPANSSSFNDSSVVENNTYRYKLTVVGTKMSASKNIEVSTPDIITALNKEKIVDEFRIYPNPSNGNLLLMLNSEISTIEIMNLSGKKVWEKKPDLLTKTNRIFEISTSLPEGIYVINIITENKSYSRKIIIN